VSIDSAILAEAKRQGVNLSKTLEDALRRLVEEERIAKWQHENRAFFEAYNAHIKRVGTMSEALLDLDEPPV
jgi:post-segregation antitoxin (ccd killing protein)